LASQIQVREKTLSGQKHDQEKVPLQLLPGKALIEIGKVLGHGAKKYDAWNWTKGIAFSRIIGAVLRHVIAFNEGEDLDPETGLSHIAHVACECLFLLTFVVTGRVELDDRASTIEKKQKEESPKP
jgi:hypothetical protein